MWTYSYTGALTKATHVHTYYSSMKYYTHTQHTCVVCTMTPVCSDKGTYVDIQIGGGGSLSASLVRRASPLAYFITLSCVLSLSSPRSSLKFVRSKTRLFSFSDLALLVQDIDWTKTYSTNITIEVHVSTLFYLERLIFHFVLFSHLLLFFPFIHSRKEKKVRKE